MQEKEKLEKYRKNEFTLSLGFKMAASRPNESHKYVIWFIQHLKVKKWHEKSTIFS